MTRKTVGRRASGSVPRGPVRAMSKLLSSATFLALLLSLSLSPGFGQVTPPSTADSLFPAKKNGKWGYIDPRGKWRIEPRFNYAKPFFEGRAVVNVLPPTSFDDKTSRWGVIDEAGEYVVEPRYAPTMTGAVPHSPFGHYSEGRIPVDVSRTFASHQHESRSEVFYLDRSGNKVLADQFDKVGQYSNGLAPVLEGEKVGYIDREGRIVIPPRYNEGLLYSNGLIAVQDTGGSFGGPWKFVNGKGETVIPGPFDEARSFHHGLAKVEKDMNVKYINREGETVFTAASMGINTSFRDDRAIVTFSTGIAEEYDAIVDKEGNVVFKLSRLDGEVCGAEPFHDGLAQLVFAPSSGEGPSACALSRNRHTSEGMLDLVPAGEEYTYGYIDTEGNLVYRGDNEEAKAMASMPSADREELTALYEKSRESFESEDWKEYLSYYSEEARTALIKEHVKSLSMGLGFAGALAEKKEGEGEVKKLARKWARLLREYGVVEKGEPGDEQLSGKKIENWPLSKKAGFYAGMINLFREQGENARPNFGTLVDMKTEGNEGAILLERRDGDGEVEKESKAVVKRNGRWMWSESFGL